MINLRLFVVCLTRIVVDDAQYGKNYDKKMFYLGLF